jgi:hypothetical protein
MENNFLFTMEHFSFEKLKTKKLYIFKMSKWKLNLKEILKTKSTFQGYGKKKQISFLKIDKKMSWQYFQHNVLLLQSFGGVLGTFWIILYGLMHRPFDLSSPLRTTKVLGTRSMLAR